MPAYVRNDRAAVHTNGSPAGLSRATNNAHRAGEGVPDPTTFGEIARGMVMPHAMIDPVGVIPDPSPR
jgi:hypothetical protein